MFFVCFFKKNSNQEVHRNLHCLVSKKAHQDRFSVCVFDESATSELLSSLCLCHALPCSAISISRLPNSACLMFFTQKSLLPFELTCVLSRGEVSSSELSVQDAAEMKRHINDNIYDILMLCMQCNVHKVNSCRSCSCQQRTARWSGTGNGGLFWWETC